MVKALGHLERVPRDGIRWPSAIALRTDIRQAQASSQPTQLSSSQPGIQSINSINVPKPVPVIGVTSRLSGGNRVVTVSFLNNPSDPNFQKVNVHLKLGGSLPVHIVSGTTSPIVFTVPRTRQPAVILLQTEGNWGPHPLQISPCRSISLI